MTQPAAHRPADLAESLANLRLEQDALALYDALGSIEKDPRRAETFRTIAGNERRHAGVWADRLRALGADVPPPERPRARVRFIIRLARLFGTNAVHDLVIGLEREEERIYASLPTSHEAQAIAADERAHAEMWEQLRADASAAAATPGSAPSAPPATPARAERWHRGGAGTLRAVVFGASDGLVSNLSLIMGIAGATPDPKF
ncbi:MAG TPA: VIT1/CCC1 transporter family protein, partial [Candidatus Limnocylindrales bacterium]